MAEKTNKTKNNSSSSGAKIEYASAPYQFINLPNTPLVSPLNKFKKDEENFADNFKNYILSEGVESGEILLEIENLTPLFIGSDANFFAPSGSPVIPGSSIRGMIRNLVKIATLGSFRPTNDEGENGGDFLDRHLYFRCLMQTKDSPNWVKVLNELYQGRMTRKENGKPVKNAIPGFLIKLTDGKYYIAPSIYKSDRKEDKILITEYQNKYGKLERRESRVRWDGEVAYILTGNQNPNKLLKKSEYERLKEQKALKNKGKQLIRFTKLSYMNFSKNSWIEIPDEVLMAYEKDSNRAGADLLKKDTGILTGGEVEKIAKKKDTGIISLIPCHYLIENNQITAFGHGQCFRIPYKNSIGDLVPKNLKEDIIDFAEAIFGRSELFAGRIFFEDGVLQNEPKIFPKDAAHPALSPNPTSYQLYLLQNEKNKLKHYDINGAKIRGYKLYWHRKNYDWRATQEERKLTNVIREISPIDKGAKFNAKIRFQNLTKYELGAILEIFSLAKNGAKFKLGWGKSFGLGSVDIKSKLFVEDKNTYAELFNKSGWNKPLKEKNFDEYLKSFESYVEEKAQTAPWKAAMENLSIMLEWDDARMNKGEWKKMVAPMEGSPMESDNSDDKKFDERFINRAPLMSLEEVRKKFNLTEK